MARYWALAATLCIGVGLAGCQKDSDESSGSSGGSAGDSGGQGTGGEPEPGETGGTPSTGATAGAPTTGGHAGAPGGAAGAPVVGGAAGAPVVGGAGPVAGGAAGAPLNGGAAGTTPDVPGGAAGTPQTGGAAGSETGGTGGEVTAGGAGGSVQCPTQDACTELDAQRCSGDRSSVEHCTTDGSGCLSWTTLAACEGADTCHDSVTAPVCSSCVDTCSSGDEAQCSLDGLGVETCVANVEGCLAWSVTTDCSATQQVCDPAMPACVILTGTGTCANPIAPQDLHYSLSGADFTADFTDDVELTESSCYGRPGSVDAVFVVDVPAGEQVRVRERSDVDVVISMQSACGGGNECLLSTDSEYNWQSYSATVDEQVYVVVETWSATPSRTAYELEIQISSPELCTGGEDEDLDGLADCLDPDCFGVAGACESEISCDDGGDNDDDGATDCDDSDCFDALTCQPALGVHELFSIGSDVLDLDWHSIVFTPDASDPFVYTFATSEIADLPYTPGPNATALTLYDDSSDVYTFTEFGSFSFYGETFPTMVVGSNGYVRFGALGSNGDVDTLNRFFEQAQICGLCADLNPDSAGAVTVDETAERVVVTFDGVPFFGQAQFTTFQVVLNADGSIELHLLSLAGEQSGDMVFVGISAGSSVDSPPAEVDFNPAPPPIVINEVAWDDASTDDREFVELHCGGGAASLDGLTLVHFNGANGSAVFAADLSGYSCSSDGFFVIGGPYVDNADAPWSAFGITDGAALQNGAESLALYADWDGSTGTPLDVLGYGDGAGPREGGFATPYVPNWEVSLGRFPDGRDSDDNSSDFVTSWWVTPGSPNTQPQPGGYARFSAISAPDGRTAFPMAIPDLSTTTSTFDVPAGVSWFPTTITDLMVGVRIEHTYIGDLTVTLTSPSGTSVVLHDETGGSSDDLLTLYDLVTSPAASLDAFNGEATAGEWTLTVTDSNLGDAGQLVEWFVLATE